MNKLKYIILILLMVPFISEACPMCQGAAEKDTVTAYKAITAFLALLPIIMGLSIYFWMKKKVKQNEKNNLL